jgi:hypothetical protein
VNRKQTGPIPEAIAQLQRQFDQFRSTQPRRTKLPEPLWQAAVELAREHGVYPVAHPLRLDYVEPALEPWRRGKGLWRKSQDFKPDRGNPAVRHYRGATGNVAMVGNENPSCNRKSRNGNPPPKAGRARALSQPQRKRGEMARPDLRNAAPVLDPTTGHDYGEAHDRPNFDSDHAALK